MTKRTNRVDDSFGVVKQIRQALSPKNRVAMIAGGVLGGFVPVATYGLAHLASEAHRNPWLWGLVGAGLLYSAYTVYDWGRVAFGNAVKAIGFVGLLEGVMTVGTSPWLSLSALAVLVGVNAIATGSNLVVRKGR